MGNLYVASAEKEEAKRNERRTRVYTSPTSRYRFLPVTPGIAGCTAVAPFGGGGQHELSAQSGATQTIGHPSCSSPISAAAVAEMCEGSDGAVEESPDGEATISGWMVLRRKSVSRADGGQGRERGATHEEWIPKRWKRRLISRLTLTRSGPRTMM